MKRVLIILAALICGNLFAQKSQQELNRLMQDRNEYFFTFTLNGNDDLQAIAHAISVDRIDGPLVTAYANNEQFNAFQKLGYQVTLQTPPSMLEKAVMWDGSNRAAYDWDAYPTYTAYENMMFQFATDHPDKCEIITLGTLPSGRKILIAHINNGTGTGKPKFLYTSTIHGDETTGWMLMLRWIDYLLENPTLPECANILNNIDLYVGPNTNPDGTYHGGNNSVNGATRYNANGVDMNRNYPDPHGSAHPDNEAYQQETQWFMQFAQDHHFVMAANYHGGAEVMNYPWDNTYTLPADDQWWQLVCQEYANLCKAVSSNYMSDVRPNGVTNGAQWYMIGGGRQDYMNGYAQCREVTIECSSTKSPSGSQMPNFWNINKDAIFAFANQCLYGIHGTVTDASTNAPVEATVTLVGHDDQYSTVSTELPNGDFHRPVKAGTYNVRITALGYETYETQVTVADNATVNINAQLTALEGIAADFTADATAINIGGTVHFTDASWAAQLNSWYWEFEGGTPATSTERNPTVTYNNAGSFGVRLTVTNAEGDSDTKYLPNYISVVEAFNMQSGTITTCGAMFYDNGGPNANYSDQLDMTLTVYPSTPGRQLEVTFQSFDVENNWDFLYIYDGTSTSATAIGTYTGSTNPGTIASTNDEGALTFKFTSDQSINKSGWAAYVRCQEIVYDPLVVEVTADQTTVEEGESTVLRAVATGGDGNYSYRWRPASTADDPTSATPTVTPEAPVTNYTVTVVDGQGTTATGAIIITIRNWAVNEINGQWSIYPNPSKGSFTIEAEGDFTYIVINSLGQQILSGKAHDKALVGGNSLPQGVYFLQLSNSLGTSTSKIVVE